MIHDVGGTSANFKSQSRNLIILAVAVGQEVQANMWAYLRDVINENRSHNCVDESEKAILVPVSTKMNHRGS